MDSGTAGYCIGIDQGSTKTIGVLVSRAGEITAVEKTSGGDHHSDGLDHQVGRIEQVCRRLLDRDGLGREALVCIYGGLTGVDWPDESTLLEDAIRNVGLCERTTVVNDTLVALRGGTSRPFGAIAVAGTGGNFAVIGPDGRQFVCSYQEQSILGGQYLGRRALELAYRDYIGVTEAARLTRAIRRFCGGREVPEVLRVQRGAREYSELAPLVFEAAHDGDQASRELLHGFGINFARFIAARSVMAGMEKLEFEVVLSGSIFKGADNPLPQIIASEVQESCPLARTVNAKYEPVVGAALLALESLQSDLPTEVVARVHSTAADADLVRRVQPAN